MKIEESNLTHRKHGNIEIYWMVYCRKDNLHTHASAFDCEQALHIILS